MKLTIQYLCRPRGNPTDIPHRATMNLYSPTPLTQPGVERLVALQLENMEVWEITVVRVETW